MTEQPSPRLPTYRVLHVEDSGSDARLVAEILSEDGDAHFVIELVATLAAARERLAASGAEVCEVILLDLGLPDSQGLDTLRATIGLAPDMPIVVLTGLDDRARGMEAVAIGAEDYLCKDEIDRGDYLARTLLFAINRRTRAVAPNTRAPASESGAPGPGWQEAALSLLARPNAELGEALRRRKPALFDDLVGACLELLRFYGNHHVDDPSIAADPWNQVDSLVDQLMAESAQPNDLLEIYSTAVRRYTHQYGREAPRDNGLLLHVLGRMGADESADN
ncbi:MAG: response regulator [Rhodocyclaceae bacterium]|nr:response regulator [Rhodocyclaceae bacterium]